MIKAVETYEYLWTMLDDWDERMDWECTSEEKLQENADDWFAERMREESMRNGEIRTTDVKFVRFYIDEDTGEDIDVEVKEVTLEYEYYHGDAIEHGYP